MKMRCTRTFNLSPTGLFRKVILLLPLLLILLYSCKKNDDNGNTTPKTPDLKVVADNLVSPLGVVSVPDQSKRLFVIDQVGKIWIIGADGNKLATPFMDVSSKMVTLTAGYDERGLLGLAFHPDYKNNGKFYIYYTLPPHAGGPQAGSSWNNLSRIASFKVSAADPNIADMNSEQVILELDDPQSNHNGGTLAFGTDGYLYIAIGDGGAADDVAPGHVTDWYKANAGGNGQDVEANLFGNILRIDVNSGSPYGIPADNPFVNKPGKDEIYAYGFRNPYRFSFDMGGTHQLFVGDAGQSLYEEVSIVTKGGNYGWNVKEGTHCFNAASDKTELGSCPMVDSAGNQLIDPVIEMKNAANPAGGVATTIIGGNVYRGKALPQFAGKYIFGIYSQPGGTPNGQIYVANAANSGLWSFDLIALKNNPNDLGYFLKGFGQDESGEIYLTVSTAPGPSGTTGKVLKLIAAE